MTVTELIERLSTLDPNIQVLLSGDEEGNDYSLVDDFSLELVERSYTGGRLEAGELLSREDLIEDRDYEEHEIDAAFKPVVVLWP